MRTIVFRRGGSSGSGSSFTGGTLTSPLILAGDPTQPLEAATKRYVDNGLAALNASNITSGTIPVARLPAFTGDISSSAGTNTLTLSNTGVAAGTYTKVTVDAKGRVTSGSALADSDIPNLHWSKITTGKPTTLSGYGITDGINKFGDTMTGPLTLSGNATSPLHAVPLQQLSEVASGSSGVEFIASGAIPNAGLTVGLNANGTVSVITENIQSGEWGGQTNFNTAPTSHISAVYDSANQKVVIAYSRNTTDYYGAAIVGTISGNSISFGTPVVFNSANTAYISTTYDTVNSKVVIVYARNATDYYGAAIVGTVSGNSISFGSPVIFSNNAIDGTSATYDSANQKVVIAYRRSNYHGVAIVGTVSGTSITFGSPVVFNSVYATDISSVYDPTNQKVVIVYVNGSNHGIAIIGTVSGNSISFGPSVVFNNNIAYPVSVIYDVINQKVVIVYVNNNFYGTTIIGTVSGGSISFGAPVVFNSAATNSVSAVYDSANQKVVIAYNRNITDFYGTAIVGTVSGDSISFEEPVVFNSAYTDNISAVYSPINNKVVIAYHGNGQHGFVRVYSPPSIVTNKNTFIGVSQNSATNGATVRVKIKGQVDSNQSGLTPGQLYYVSNNGTLTTTSTNNPLAGVAISATKLLIANWTIS